MDAGDKLIAELVRVVASMRNETPLTDECRRQVTDVYGYELDPVEDDDRS